MDWKNNKKGNYLVGGIIAIILGFLIIGGMPIDNNYVSDNNSENISENVTNKDDGQKVESKVDSELKISYIDVGQADSILIQNEGKNMLIDAGNNADGDLIVKYLKGLRYK